MKRNYLPTFLSGTNGKGVTDSLRVKHPKQNAPLPECERRDAARKKIDIALATFRLPVLAKIVSQLPKHDSSTKIRNKWRNALGYKHLALYVVANRMSHG
jgi:hypothetical protein